MESHWRVHREGRRDFIKEVIPLTDNFLKGGKREASNSHSSQLHPPAPHHKGFWCRLQKEPQATAEALLGRSGHIGRGGRRPPLAPSSLPRFSQTTETAQIRQPDFQQTCPSLRLPHCASWFSICTLHTKVAGLIVAN